LIVVGSTKSVYGSLAKPEIRVPLTNWPGTGTPVLFCWTNRAIETLKEAEGSKETKNLNPTNDGVEEGGMTGK